MIIKTPTGNLNAIVYLFVITATILLIFITVSLTKKVARYFDGGDDGSIYLAFVELIVMTYGILTLWNSAHASIYTPLEHALFMYAFVFVVATFIAATLITLLRGLIKAWEFWC